MLQQITDDMKQAMRDKNKSKLAVIRMLRAALKDKEIELGRDLEHDDIMAVIIRAIKQRKDAAQQYTDAQRDDLAAKEQEEIEHLHAYLPEQLSEEELHSIIQDALNDTGASSMRDMGRVMGVIRPKVEGRADMGVVSAQIKSTLQGL